MAIEIGCFAAYFYLESTNALYVLYIPLDFCIVTGMLVYYVNEFAQWKLKVKAEQEAEAKLKKDLAATLLAKMAPGHART